MNWCKALCVLSIAIYGSACLAQDITDVEAKPYGSYTGGAIDTVDLATGNLMLNIPLISFPQLGKLPPLSFAVELNNAPYSQTGNAACDSGTFDGHGYQIECELLSSRYDTSPPGAVYRYGVISNEAQPDLIEITDQNTCVAIYNTSAPCYEDDEWFYEDAQADISEPTMNVGAYLTSSFEGGIVTGRINTLVESGNPPPPPQEAIQLSMVDSSGTTHELESDNSNPPSSWNTYRAPDGSGYTFVPYGVGSGNNAYDPFNQAGQDGFGGDLDSNRVWLENASDYDASTEGGVRLGTLYSPTGIQFATNTVHTFTPVSTQNNCNQNVCTPQALISTETDPTGNSITRGPWYWSGYYSSQNSPILDISSYYKNQGYASGPSYTDSVGRIIPDVVSMQATQYGMSGPSGEPTLTWTVPGPENNTITYKITYMGVSNIQIWNPQSESGPPDPSVDVAVPGWGISSILLPNNTKWTFTYANSSSGGYSAGDLETVTTPSNGTITYTYTTIPFVSPIGLTRCNAVCHAVASRTESDGLSTPGVTHSWTTTYSYGVLSSLQSCPTVNAKVYAFTTTETDPAGNDTVHSFCAQVNSAGGVSLANQYHEILTQYYQGTGSSRTLLKTVQTASESQMDIAPPYTGGTAAGLINYLPKMITTNTPGGTTTDMRQYSNDSNQNNPPKPLFTATRIFCIYNQGSACGPVENSAEQAITIPISYLSPTTDTIEAGNTLSTTSTTYEFQNSPSTYTYWHMDALPVSETVSGYSGGSGVASGTTSYGYDENNGSCQGADGNQTSKTETYYLSGSTNPGGTSIKTQTVYNCKAMPTDKIDANGNTTTITYDPTTFGLFPINIQRPTTNGVQHTDGYSYDLNTGNLNSHTDENGQTTRYQYDLMGRVTSIQYPDGGGSTFCYTDIGGSIPGCTQNTTPPFSLYTSTTTGTTTAPTPPVITMHTYDGWGRQYTSSVLSDPLGPTIVDTAYDWEGKVTSASNPYRSTPATNDPPQGTTSYIYDALGRKTIQTQPDGSTQQWCYDGVGTFTPPGGEPANCPHNAPTVAPFVATGWTDVFDETGRHSQQVFDALGHMDAVVEPDPAFGSLALETDYTYDVFGDLLKVYQAGASGSTPVTRFFTYDIPSRVTFACNPEALAAGQNCTSSSGGTRYVYDANSNLTSKTDNRSVTTGYSYDALNRLLSKMYSNDPSGTASSCYLYDGGASSTNSSTTTNGSGRLAAQWTQKGACPNPPVLPSSGILTETTISGYDAMGRLMNENRCMGTNCATGGYAMSYTYDLTGKLLTYPSGAGSLAFTNSYDSAGRLSRVMQGATNPPLFSVPSYTPAGALSGVQLGNYINMSRTFDSRQRVTGETDSVTTQ